MENIEYEQKKRECWETFLRLGGGEAEIGKISTFAFAFNRGYALGKETETITQDDIEKASVEYSTKTVGQYEVCNSEFVQEIMVAFEAGAKFALGKQKKDAEGEEMLTVSRNRVQELYKDYCTERDNEEKGSVARFSLGGRIAVLQELYGSKCLLDNVDSSEPNVDSSHGNVESLDSKPAEPKETFTDKRKSQFRNLSQETANCDKQFDNILKGSLLKERRLNIAAMVMQGIVANQDITRYLSDLGHENAVAAQAILYADALIDGCESLKK